MQRYLVIAEGNGMVLPIATNVTEEEAVKKAGSTLCVSYTVVVIDDELYKYNIVYGKLVKTDEKLNVNGSLIIRK